MDDDDEEIILRGSSDVKILEITEIGLSRGKK